MLYVHCVPFPVPVELYLIIATMALWSSQWHTFPRLLGIFDTQKIFDDLRKSELTPAPVCHPFLGWWNVHVGPPVQRLRRRSSWRGLTAWRREGQAISMQVVIGEPRYLRTSPTMAMSKKLMEILRFKKKKQTTGGCLLGCSIGFCPLFYTWKVGETPFVMRLFLSAVSEDGGCDGKSIHPPNHVRSWRQL